MAKGVRLFFPCAKDALKAEVRGLPRRDGAAREKLNQRVRVRAKGLIRAAPLTVGGSLLPSAGVNKD